VTDWANFCPPDDGSLWAVFWNYRSRPTFWLLFPSIDYALFSTKMRWAGLHFGRSFHKLIAKQEWYIILTVPVCPAVSVWWVFELMCKPKLVSWRIVPKKIKMNLVDFLYTLKFLTFKMSTNKMHSRLQNYVTKLIKCTISNATLSGGVSNKNSVKIFFFNILWLFSTFWRSEIRMSASKCLVEIEGFVWSQH
jgi:hypothetical protein